MSDNVKTVLNKRFGLALIKMGFPLVNVEVSVKVPGDVIFFFRESEELEKAFSQLLNENKLLKGMYGITLEDLEILLKVLQNYDVSDVERYPVMEKIQGIVDKVYDVKPYTGFENKEPEENVNIDINGLKQSMSGCK
jgi:hypothetical protein